MTILLAALLVFVPPISTPSAINGEIYVRSDLGTSVESLATIVRPIGRIESRTPGTSIYLIGLNPNIQIEAARERIAKISWLHLVDPDEEPLDLQSARSLGRKIADLSEDEENEKQAGNAVKAERDAGGLDYLRAYQYFVGMRAYPNDQVDWNAYGRAQAHVSQMKSAVLSGSASDSRSEIGGSSWSFVGPTNLTIPYTQYFGRPPVNGRFNAVAFDPNNSQVIYGGAAQGGLWKTSDGGVTWNWLSTGWAHLGVNCIAVDPQDGNTIYVGLGDYHGYIGGSVGIMKSTDGGATWTEIATSSMGQIGVPKILIDPTNHQTLIAGTGDVNAYGKLYRSVNSGQTWTMVNSLGRAYWPALAASLPVGSTTRFYAVAAGYAETSGSPASRVYKSDDHGATWQLLPSPVSTGGSVHWAYCIATSPIQPNNVYVLDSENAKLYESTNQGSKWTNISGNLPQGSEISAKYNFSQSFYDYHLECGSRTSGSSITDLLYMGEIDIFDSENNGSSWQTLGGPTYTASAATHNDQHDLAVCPTNPNFAVFSNDGGIYTVTYDPASGNNPIVSLNKNLGASMFYHISAHPTNPDILLGGTQDYSSPMSNGDISNWQNEGGGDGGGCAINQTNPLIQYATAEGLFVARTSTGWKSSVNISPNHGVDPTPFVATTTLAPSDQGILYTGTNYLYQWSEATQTWRTHLGATRLAGPVSGTSKPLIQAIAVAPSDETRIYTGSTDGELWMSTDTGTKWTRLNAGTTSLPNLTITSISVSPTNPSDILIGLSGTGFPHLWRCQNTQVTKPTFTSVSATGTNSLPDISLNAIARDLDYPTSVWFVGTDLGVYQTRDSGATWANAGAPLGLPNVLVEDLVAVPGTRYLNAGTYGRGFWRIYLPVPTLSLTSLTLSSSAVRQGNTVQGAVTLGVPAPSGGVLIELSSSNPSAATVPSTLTIAAGATSASFSVTAGSGLSAPASTAITASYNGVKLTQNLVVTVPTISGTVTFGDYTATPPTSVTLNFRLPGAATPFKSMTVSLDAGGNFTAQNVPAEAYSVYIQTGTWLRRTLALDLSTSDVTNADFLLVNGDVNGDNRIDDADLRLLSAAIGSNPLSPNWNPNADLNGDGIVNGNDLAILYKNLHRIGDP